jgi:transcriptional regulator with XRE-family HTH domain
MNIERFGEKLKILRLQKGLTTRQLAFFLHTTNSQISRVENGLRKPSAELILQTADYFNVSLDQLMRDELDLEERP